LTVVAESSYNPPAFSGCCVAGQTGRRED